MRRLLQRCCLFALLGIAMSPRPTWALPPNEIKITQPPAGVVLTHHDALAAQIQFGFDIDTSSIQLTIDHVLVLALPYPPYDGPDTRGFVIPSLVNVAYGAQVLRATATTRDGRFVTDGVTFTVTPAADEIPGIFAAALELLREGEAAGAFSAAGAALIRESLLAALGSSRATECARLRCAFLFAHCESLSSRTGAAMFGFLLQKAISVLEEAAGCPLN